jgi:hypothetical protein
MNEKKDQTPQGKLSPSSLPDLDRSEVDEAAELAAAKAFRREVMDSNQGGQCEWCQDRPATDAHHICPRGRGAGHPMLHDSRNGSALCRQCHDDVHTADGHTLLDTILYLDLLERTKV